jgi:hypothetical protein
VLGDKHVHFDCSKLQGYSDAKFKIEESNWEFSIEGACESSWLGMTNGLNWKAPSAFSVDMGSGRIGILGASYDHDSIMHYPSVSFAAQPVHGIQGLPLVRWKNGPPKDGKGVDESNAEVIPLAPGPSDGDKQGIKHLYPWLGW